MIKLCKKQSEPPAKRRQAILWGGLFCITVGLNILARLMPEFAEWYASKVYPLLVGSLGRFSSLFPFSVSELLLAAGLLWAVVKVARALIRLIKRPAQRQEEPRAKGTAAGSLKNVALSAGKLLLVLLFVFTINCGINYHRLTFSHRAGFSVQESTVEELAELCLQLTEEINEEAQKISVDEQGGCLTSDNLQERAVEAMQAAGETYPDLAGYYPNAKEIFSSRIFSYQQLQGIYSPFTIEANYNRDMPEYNKPAAICHELSHLKGFMREDEANFIAYLACRASKDADFRYSGSMLAYVYSMNALYREDPELYFSIRAQLCEQANRDMKLDREFWDAYKGTVAEVSDKVNDTYLKANAQTDGTKSYGRMVDLLLALQRTENAG